MLNETPFYAIAAVQQCPANMPGDTSSNAKRVLPGVQGRVSHTKT